MVRFGLFLSSYAILFAILALRFTEPILRSTMAVLFLAGVLSVFLILRAEQGKAPGSFDIVSADDLGAEAAGYLGTYLLPFVTISSPAPTDLLAYGLFLGVVYVIYVSSDMVRLNPLLYLFGRRVFRIESANRFRGYLISHSADIKRTGVLATRFSNDVLIESSEPLTDELTHRA